MCLAVKGAGVVPGSSHLHLRRQQGSRPKGSIPKSIVTVVGISPTGLIDQLPMQTCESPVALPQGAVTPYTVGVATPLKPHKNASMAATSSFSVIHKYHAMACCLHPMINRSARSLRNTCVGSQVKSTSAFSHACSTLAGQGFILERKDCQHYNCSPRK